MSASVASPHRFQMRPDVGGIPISGATRQMVLLRKPAVDEIGKGDLPLVGTPIGPRLQLSLLADLELLGFLESLSGLTSPLSGLGFSPPDFPRARAATFLT